MSDSTAAFLCGLLFGASGLAALMIAGSNTPQDMKKDMEKQAVLHGNGKYIVDVSSKKPAVKFEWITHTNQ